LIFGRLRGFGAVSAVAAILRAEADLSEISAVKDSGYKFSSRLEFAIETPNRAKKNATTYKTRKAKAKKCWTFYSPLPA